MFMMTGEIQEVLTADGKAENANDRVAKIEYVNRVIDNMNAHYYGKHNEKVYWESRAIYLH